MRSHRCYTNHALDQFLEHCLENGIERIIRIGGQSNSTVLEGKNLRVVSQNDDKSKLERYQLALSYKAMEDSETKIKSKLDALQRLEPNWKNLEKHLAQIYPSIRSQFPRVDEEGFELAGRMELFDLWKVGKGQSIPLRKDSVGDINDILHRARGDVFDLSLADRQALLGHWVRERRDALMVDIQDAKQSFDDSQRSKANVNDEADRRVLETADIIGVTTSGLARRISVLRHVNTKVIICEEAGEVIEAHMLSALIPSVQHLIQIGDHQQLRPQINDFVGLSLESSQGRAFKLDRSQFERLSIGGWGRPPFPVAQLDVQRRMRPEISTLIKNTQYPRLKDHISVQNLPDVVGMRKNVFWLDHNNAEESQRPDTGQKSKSNLWEVDITHALVRHVVRQGVYSSKDIAVLTPYTGQLQKLYSKMGSDFEVVLSERDQDELAKDGYVAEDSNEQISSKSNGNLGPLLEKRNLKNLLRIATVDNFQGEEAKIAIISLVRSNEVKRVGFLKTENRINVLLSRAKHGMYLIGNSETYSNIPMWATVLGMLRLSDSVGRSIGLCCPRHPETAIDCSKPDDFALLSPEGGCRLTCERRLDSCGHQCLAKCHSEAMHRAFMCPQPCQRLHEPCGHGCPKICGQICGPCRLLVNNTQLPCGHIMDNIQCHQSLEPDKLTCKVQVDKILPRCGHMVHVPCYHDVSSGTFNCPIACKAFLGCGHSCNGTCGQCSRIKEAGMDDGEHMKCRTSCGRPFSTCAHFCPKPCHEGVPCGVCISKCEVRVCHTAR